METLLSIMTLGFFLGMRHATDADHVVAVAAIVSRERRLGVATLIGTIWGIGHGLTVFAVGGAIVLLKLTIPAALGLSMELAVALILVFLGALNLSGLLGWVRDRFGSGGHRRYEIHAHPHPHGDLVHDHTHVHVPPEAAGRFWEPSGRLWGLLGRIGTTRLLRPLVVGFVHGLAGSAALALIVVGGIREPAWALAYLAIYGMGTLAGMTLITTAIGLPVIVSAHRFSRVHRALGVTSGLLSLGFGLFLIYKIGIVDGLFTGGSGWHPR